MSFKKSATRTELLAAVEMVGSLLDGATVKQVGERFQRGPAWVELRVETVWARMRGDDVFRDTFLRERFKSGLFGSARFQPFMACAKAALAAFREELLTLPESGPLGERRERAKGELRGLSDRAVHSLRSNLGVTDLASLKNAISQGLVVREDMNIGPGTYQQIIDFAASSAAELDR